MNENSPTIPDNLRALLLGEAEVLRGFELMVGSGQSGRHDTCYIVPLLSTRRGRTLLVNGKRQGENQRLRRCCCE